MKRLIFIPGIIFLCSLWGYSQDFGGFSPEIRWQQINTDAVRVIYPEGLYPQAARVTSLIRYMNENNRTTIGDNFKKLDLVLNNQGVIPNGYVTLMPYRSEFFTTPLPMSELGSLPWLDLLSVHEYRHALQYSNFRRGITKVGYWLMGETFWAIALNLATPDWFFEGDAIMTETALTPQGRGRIPSFNQGYQSILANRKPFTYQKARNGSLRSEVPDHYRLGYLLGSYGRDQYGADLWMNVYHRTARYKGIIYPFSKALKHYTGLKTRHFYKEAMAYYQLRWDSLNQLLPEDPSWRLTPEYRRVTHYDYPNWDPASGKWLAVRHTYRSTPAIVSIDENGKQEKLTDIGIHLDPAFSAGKDFIIWAELSFDPRFSTRSYSDLVCYDRQSGKKSYLTRNQRLFSPDLSPDQHQILAVSHNKAGETRLLILDRSTGQTLDTIPNPEGYYYTYPQWSEDGAGLYASVRTLTGQMSVIHIPLTSRESRILMEPVNHLIGKLAVGDNRLYFSSTFEGRQNLFSLDPESGDIRQISSSSYGAANPSLNRESGELAYMDYHHTGQQLRVVDVTGVNRPVSLTPLDELPDWQNEWFAAEGGSILNSVETADYEPKAYRADLKALKLHSWSPVLAVSPTALGLSLVSDNVFNNIHLDGGYRYYLNEQSGGFGINVEYGRLFPVLSLGFDQSYRNGGINSDSGENPFPERNFSAGVRVPLDFSKGMFYRHFDGSLQLRHTTIPTVLPADDFSGGKTRFATAGAGMVFQARKLKARQNITTPLGIGLDLTYQRSVTGTQAGQLQVFADASIRGIGANHNLVTGLSLKAENAQNLYQYLDLNVYPRGYGIPQNNWIATWQWNYHFPLLYPDFGFGGLIYFQRIRGNLFMDIGIGDTFDPTISRMGLNRFQSLGVELITDLKLIHLLPLSMGVRLSFLGYTDHYHPGRSSYVEFFIPVIRI